MQAYVEDGLLTFENVAKTLVVHLGRTVENVAALPETGGKVLRCFGFTRASRTCRGTPQLQMQRLTFESTAARRNHVAVTGQETKLPFQFVFERACFMPCLAGFGRYSAIPTLLWAQTSRFPCRLRRVRVSMNSVNCRPSPE